MRKQDEQELENIMQETFTNSSYHDQEIGKFLKSNQQPALKARSRTSSQSHSDSNDFNPLPANVYRDSFQSHPQSDPSQDSQDSQSQSPNNIVDLFHKPSLIKDGPFADIENQLLQLNEAIPLQLIKQTYPVYLISQPKYSITDNIVEKTFQYNKLKDKNIQSMDIGYCKEAQAYRIVVATDECELVVFEQDYNKPVVILQPFGNTNSSIMAVRWSQRLQYLAVSNDMKQVKVYMFKQAIQIQNKQILRPIKNPTEYGSINQKKLQNTVIDIHFISQSPQLLLLDEEEQILTVEFKKHILNIRPYISVLPVKFNDIGDIAVIEKHLFGIQASFMAVAGQDFVTLCALKPEFQIILVYDKQKHGPSRKNGFPSVSFRKDPFAIMIIWDKFVEIINIKLESLEPLKYNMEVAGRALFPESSILGGFLSDTLVYQVSRIGCKVYSANRLTKQINQKPLECIHNKNIDYNWVPHGSKILQHLNNNHIQASALRIIRGIICVNNGMFFLSSNTSLQSFRVQNFDKYISNIIENINNWKVGLQILHDAYHRVVFQLDGITIKVIVEKLRQYSLRYFVFLKSVIEEEHTDSTQQDILNNNIRGKHGVNKKSSCSLWDQEVLFLFNILLETEQVRHLMDKVLPTLLEIKPGLIDNLTPFILSKKIKYISLQSLHIIKDQLDRNIMRELLSNLDPHQNQSELPLQINKLLLEEQLYLEIIQINNAFGDYYTPFVLMLAKYSLIHDSYLARLIGFNSYIFLREINRDSQKQRHFAFYLYHNHKQEMKQLMNRIQWFLSLLTEQIYQILLKEYPQILFSYVLDQLFRGKCLQVMNSLTNYLHPRDLMTETVQKIPYTQVIETGCQKEYWISIFDLHSRKVISKDVWVGIKFLTGPSQRVQPGIIDSLVSSSEIELKREFSKLSQDTLRQFFNQIIDSSYISLIRLLGLQLKEYLKVLHCLLSSPLHRNIQLYNYLDEVCPKMVPAQIDQLKSIFKTNIQLFTSIDAQRAASMIGTHFSSSAQMLASYLTAYPQLQLQLVEQILIANSFHCSDQLKIRYFKKQKVLPQLKKEAYPIDQSLQVCQKYQVLDGYAHLLVKSGGEGDVASAINIYFQILCGELHLSEEQFTSRLLSALNQCIDICVHLDLGGDFHYEREWFIIMDQMEALKKKAYKDLPTYESQRVRQIINTKAYPELVRALVSNVDSQNIISHLRSIDHFDVQAIRTIVHQLVKNYLYQREVLQLCQQVYIESELSFRHKITGKGGRGFLTKSVCSVCHRREKGVLVHYTCGHQIHPSCGNDVKECLICSESIQFVFQRQLNTRNNIKPTLHSQLGDGFMHSPNKRYRNKAEIFEKIEIFQEMNQFEKVYPSYDNR